MDVNKYYYEPFAVRLRLLFDETGASQQEVADYIGVSRQAVAQWKDGKTIPDMYNFKKAAEYFKVPYEYLYGDTDSRVKENMTLAETLGLSDGAIEVLQSISNSENEINESKADALSLVLSEIIEDERFIKTLEYLQKAVAEHKKYQQKSMESGSTGDFLGFEYNDLLYINDIGKSVIAADEMAVFCIYQAVDLFRQTIEKMPEKKYRRFIGLD